MERDNPIERRKHADFHPDYIGTDIVDRAIEADNTRNEPYDGSTIKKYKLPPKHRNEKHTPVRFIQPGEPVPVSGKDVVSIDDYKKREEINKALYPLILKIEHLLSKNKKAVPVLLVIIALSVFSLGFLSDTSPTGNAISAVPLNSFYHVILSLSLIAIAAIVFWAEKNGRVKFFYK